MWGWRVGKERSVFGAFLEPEISRLARKNTRHDAHFHTLPRACAHDVEFLKAGCPMRANY